ncbi:MAG TPA: acetyl-CoA carboxylase biotin carboxyl carrier protein subunit, partial [Leptospiraceae bacterium]|nr:acetyl-CoA carboxylase biotin carboxyl carrier protein subunit [Leptospiraceae bacterium]
FKSPMPGKIISVRVRPGDNVVEGDILMIVEAMKMENQIRAYSDLSIEEVYFKEGDLVTGDDQLLKAIELDS